MKEIIELLKAIIESPEDLSGLPGVISKLEEYETTNATRQSEDLDKITKLQSANRNLLSQIPISTGEPEPPKEEEDSFEEAKKQLINAMKTVGGNV